MTRATIWVIGLFLVVLAIGVGCGGNSPEPRQSFKVAGKTYTEKYTCSQQFTGEAPFCADLNAVDTIQFFSVGTNSYEVKDVPDTGFLYVGSFVERDFIWTATSPDGYTESGTWTFDARGNSFSGSSSYTANDGSYSGECNTNGVLAPSVPSDPPVLGACP
jgi:hypothetical protein